MLCVSENKTNEKMKISSESHISMIKENKQDWSNILNLLTVISNEVAVDQYSFDVKSKNSCEKAGRE